MHWDFALILVVLGVLVPWLGRRRVGRLMRAIETTKTDRLALYGSTVTFQWFAAAVVLWRATGRHIGLAQLGLAAPSVPLTATVSVVLSSLVLLNQIISLRRVTTNPQEVKAALPQLAIRIFPQDRLERLVFFAVVGTVAICEEFIYRGFTQQVLADWSGGSLAAGILGSAALFAWAHLYQGRRGLASTFLAGILFSGVRAWTGSLLPTIAAHFVADLVVGLMAPARFRAAMAQLDRENECSKLDAAPGGPLLLHI
ncbi:MAG TPA: CPBP family intramembrane glutamic endopeptidase [Verrucomicrobiae bacterium]|jgi:membrane protease YdiL (CAAX protease family)|nr:CPBP family intramembrane glutamic endopeptidase [Verrucomicrobiae bacterium]